MILDYDVSKIFFILFFPLLLRKHILHREDNVQIVQIFLSLHLTHLF